MPNRHTPAAPPSASTDPQRGFAQPIEIFRAGSHVDSKGRRCEYSEADLDQMVANVALGAPPAVIGHPKEADPAYGWATELTRDGGSLFARFTDVNPAFEAGVESGAYRNRSVSLVRDPTHGWRVRHIGWLGAQPPAIDGLRPVQFAAGGDEDAHEFSSASLSGAWSLETIAGAFRSLRDWLIESQSLELADRVMPPWTIDSLVRDAQRIREEVAADDTATGGAVPVAAFTAAGADVAQLELDRITRESEARGEARVRAELNAAAERSRAEFAAQAAELQRVRLERDRARIDGLIAGWRSTGRVVPAEAVGMREFMLSIDSAGGSFEFAAAGGAALSVSPSQWFADYVSRRSTQVRIGAKLGNDDADPEVTLDSVQSIADAAREYQASEAAAGRTVSIELAVARVSSKSVQR